jgi:hypothetical protein
MSLPQSRLTNQTPSKDKGLYHQPGHPCLNCSHTHKDHSMCMPQGCLIEGCTCEGLKLDIQPIGKLRPQVP